MRDGKRVLDADAHVLEPLALYAEVLPRGVPLFDLPETAPLTPCGDPARVRDQVAHGFDPRSYLRAMDVEGIDAAILFPSAGLFVPYLPELGPAEAERACRAYNRWVAAYCGEAPSRLAAVGLVPLCEVARAVSVAEEAARLGLCGVVVRPNFLYGRTLGDPQYDPLYECLESHHLVLALHEGLGVRGTVELGSDRFRTFAARHACSHPMEQMAGLASLILEGSLERHPRLRVALFESGTGWLPYWLDRLDAHVEWMRGAETGHLTLSPSEYFQRQCVIAAEPEDSLVGWVVARHGADHVVWASDFPNPDSIYPEAVETFLSESARAGLADRDVAAILWDTPLRFFGLEHRLAGIEAPFSPP